MAKTYEFVTNVVDSIPGLTALFAKKIASFIIIIFILGMLFAIYAFNANIHQLIVLPFIALFVMYYDFGLGFYILLAMVLSAFFWPGWALI